MIAIGPGLELGFVFAFGAIVGSFLNVVIHRVPIGLSIVRPGSHCPACETAIPPWANVPVLSYLALRGRCFHCGVHISGRYPLVEALTAGLFAAAWWLSGPDVGWRVGVDWALLSALVAISFIDLDHKIIPNSITFPGLALGLVLAAVWPPASWSGELPFVWSAVLGVVLGAGMLWLTAWLYERWSGQMGLGMGDVKLVAMLGAFLGFDDVLGVIVLGSLLGIVHGVALIAWSGGGRKTRIPFGPALALAGALHVLEPGLFSRLSAVLSGASSAGG